MNDDPKQPALTPEELYARHNQQAPPAELDSAILQLAAQRHAPGGRRWRRWGSSAAAIAMLAIAIGVFQQTQFDDMPAMHSVAPDTAVDMQLTEQRETTRRDTVASPTANIPGMTDFVAGKEVSPAQESAAELLEVVTQATWDAAANSAPNAQPAPTELAAEAEASAAAARLQRSALKPSSFKATHSGDEAGCGAIPELPAGATAVTGETEGIEQTGQPQIRYRLDDRTYTLRCESRRWQLDDQKPETR
ncbi:MAG: hypothetical protein AAF513_03115 [Pseudomonadota bacterium]